MRVRKDGEIIAILGTISGTVPMDALCEFHKPKKILLWEFDGISDQVYKWSKGKNIEIKQYYPQPWTHENKIKALREIAQTADSIFLFHDYHPSSWVDMYNSTKGDDPLDEEALLVKEFGEEFGKIIKVTKLEKIYHHSFMISEEGEKGGHIFDIPIPSKDMNVDSARGEAMAKAQMYFINYIYSPLHRKYAGFYHLHRLEGRYWKDVSTHQLEMWFKNIVTTYSNEK